MTEYHRMIPSAVLGEYLSDVYRFESAAYAKVTRDDKLAPCKKEGQGLGPTLAEWFGEEIAYDYWRTLDKRAKARPNERTPYPFVRARATPVKANPSKKIVDTATILAEPKRKPWQDARHVNEYKMREAILKVVGRHGWTSAGIRKLADLAKMKHRTARTVLDRMAADGQVKLDTSWGQGKRTGVYVVREHPCWSDQKHAQSLALSKLSDQLRV
jgi:hypothetical protein